MKRIAFSLLALLLAALACARTGLFSTPTPLAISPGDTTRSLLVDGLERSYILHIPPAYTADQPIPVVLVFHGGLGTAEGAIHMTGFSAQADAAGFVAVYPNGTGRLENLLTWNAGECCGYAQEQNVDDVAFIRALLTDLASIVNVDDKRVYATGMSNGALMSYWLACELSEQIAAIAPVAGTQNVAVCQPSHPVSVIHFHGTNDQNVLYEGGPGPRSLTQTDFTSVYYSIQFWVSQNGCPATPVTERFGEIIHDIYSPCAQGTAVELYTIVGGGHARPGGQKYGPNAPEPTGEISATELMWLFFEAHPKP